MGILKVSSQIFISPEKNLPILSFQVDFLNHQSKKQEVDCNIKKWSNLLLHHPKIHFMRILITGATGLLGSNLVRLLIHRGYSVGVFIQTRSYTKTLHDLPIRKHFGDILDKESLEAAVQEYDVVIHAAAITDYWPSRSQKI